MALLGHNGAGKSTLLRILAGQEFPTKGAGMILNSPIGRDLGEKKAKIGLVSENIHFDFQVSLKVFFDHYREIFPEWNDFLFHDLLKKTEIKLNRDFSSFSRGQRMQLVMIAALSINPKLLLVDEVTSVLDIKARKYFIKLIKEFCQQGGSCVLTSNIIYELQGVISRLVILDRGKIKLNSTVEEQMSHLVKLRKSANEELPKDFLKVAKWVGINSDGSDTYVLEKENAQYFKHMEADRRKLTLAEIFMFYSEKGIVDDQSLLAS